MKLQMKNEIKAKSQSRLNINNVSNEIYQSTKQGRSEFAILPNHPSVGGAGGRLCNGPPGGSRSPGAGRGHPPENKAGPPVGQTPSNIEIDQFNIKQKINFHKHLNFTIMKKQILFLAFLVLAAFANVNKSYGQTALAPSPGIAYDYAVTIAGATGASGQKFHFYITKATDLVGGAKETVGTDFTVNAGATYDNAANTVDHINLTWTLASTTSVTAFYLVVKYTETNASGCAVENMKVWQIKSINTFYLTFVPSDVTGATVAVIDAHQCAAGIGTANITVVNADPTLSRVTYTYGKNTLYYKVTAAGMLGTWRPDISLPILGGLSQVYESVEWNDNATGTGTWHPFVGAAGTSAAGTFSSANTDLATIADATAGTSHLIRIVIDNKNFETLFEQPIPVGVDGYLPPFPSTTSDVVSATVLSLEAPFGKTATNTIQPRPTSTGTTITFVTKNP